MFLARIVEYSPDQDKYVNCTINVSHIDISFTPEQVDEKRRRTYMPRKGGSSETPSLKPTPRMRIPEARPLDRIFAEDGLGPTGSRAGDGEDQPKYKGVRRPKIRKPAAAHNEDEGPSSIGGQSGGHSGDLTAPDTRSADLIDLDDTNNDADGIGEESVFSSLYPLQSLLEEGPKAEFKMPVKPDAGAFSFSGQFPDLNKPSQPESSTSRVTRKPRARKGAGGQAGGALVETEEKQTAVDGKKHKTMNQKTPRTNAPYKGGEESIKYSSSSGL
jgi:hypothetical protein